MTAFGFVRGLVLLVLACCGPGAIAADETSRADQAAYEQFSRAFLDWYYAEHPVRATSLGIHDYDGRLASFTRQAMERRAAALRGWLEELRGIERDRLEGPARQDYVILGHAIRVALLELEEVQGWRRNPMSYTNYIARALASLVDREFAPVEQRLQSMNGRLRQVPLVLASARDNLESVPPLWVELAVRSTRGLWGFLRDDVPRALAAQGMDRVDEALREQWRQALDEAVAALEAHVEWLEDDLAARANGDFRLGKALFERKLQLEEFVDLDADELRRINRRAIEDYQERVADAASEYDSTLTPAETMEKVTGSFPAPGDLIPTARRYVEQTREFIIERDLVTLPSDTMPVVRETPEYARMGFASMSTPGPFEDKATEAYYNITNVDGDWSDEEKRQHLTYFNYPALLGITVHEAFPGHFVQLLYERQIPTEVRKVFTPASLVEGWAHYAEQMTVDEGLGGGDPAVRLAQLRRALQRHARWHAGLSMHAFGNSVEDVVPRYREIAYFDEFPALREVQRGTYNPTYLYYAMGRMQILELREDFRVHLEAQGGEFSLKAFHDRFLRLGLPVSLAREVMLGEGSGPSLPVPGNGGDG